MLLKFLILFIVFNYWYIILVIVMVGDYDKGLEYNIFDREI